MPCLAARHTAADRRTHAQAILPQPRGSRFQTHWFLHLLLLQHCHETVQEPFSYLARRFLHLLDWRHLHSLNRRGTRPVNGHHPRGWTSDLFSSQLRPDLRGALWRAAYAPGDGQISPAYSSQPVQCLYINCLLFVNKPVLSYLLLHLVPHIVGYRWNRRFWHGRGHGHRHRAWTLNAGIDTGMDMDTDMVMDTRHGRGHRAYKCTPGMDINPSMDRGVNITVFPGVCSTDLWLDTSTNGLEQA